MTGFQLSRLAENVKRHREAAGLSQRGLAREAGLSQPTVLAIEQGSSPSVDSVVRIAKALNVALNDLIDDAPRTIEEMIPGWGRLSPEEQHHVRALIASIAASRGQRAGLRAAEQGAPYLGDNAAAIEEARRESERLSAAEERDQEDGGDQRQRRRGQGR